MIMDTLGALALATEPPNDELMKRAPVGRKGNFISNVMWRNILGQSLYQFLIIWFLQVYGKTIFRLDGPDANLTLNTVIFNSFVFCQVNYKEHFYNLCEIVWFVVSNTVRGQASVVYITHLFDSKCSFSTK